MTSPSPSLLASLSKLKSLIKKLPPSCPPAPKNGEIHHHFSIYDVPDGESPYFVVDQAWNRVFQGKENVAIGGKYGVGVVYDFFNHFAKQPLGGDLVLLELRISQFIRLVEDFGSTKKSLETTPTVYSASQPRTNTVPSVGCPLDKTPLDAPPSSDDESRSLSKGGEDGDEDVSGSDYAPSSTDDGNGDKDLGSDEEIDTEDEIIEIEAKGLGAAVTVQKSATAPRKPPSKVLKKSFKPISQVKASVRGSRGGPSLLKSPLSAKKVSSKPTFARNRSSAKSKIQATSRITSPKARKVLSTNKEPGTKRPGGARKAQGNDPLSGSSGEDDAEMVDVPMGGRKAVKATWAFEQFNPTPGTNKRGNPVWVWRCQWCPVMRTTPRTPKVKEYGKETLPRPKSSNFISHLKPENCRIPEAACFENFGKELPASSESILPTVGYAAERKIMLDFTERGRASPARKFTKEGFRAAFVKGVIEDGLPFTFGEGQGMKKLFGYSLPEVLLPKRMTIRRDLDILYTALQSELWGKIKSLKSRPSIAFDIWSSRNSVFAFIGMEVFWISSDWVLENHVLDLIHLDDDHGGATSGKHIFLSLKESGVAEKMSGPCCFAPSLRLMYRYLSALHMLASGADNATSNGVTHRAIAKRRAKAFHISVDPQTTGLGCAGHVIHLSAQDLLAAFNIVEPSGVIDHFRDTNRRHGIHYSAEADADIIAQEAEFEADDKKAEELRVKRRKEMAKGSRPMKERGSKGSAKVTLVSDSDGDSSRAEHQTEDEESDNSDLEWEEEAGITTEIRANGSAPIPAARTLNPLEKIHSFVSHVNCSVIRRRNFRKFVEKHCSSDCHRLSLVKGMRVRWNSSYSEYKRALKLKLAIDAYIAQMTQGKTGQKLAEARKRQLQLYMSFPEWDSVAQLCDVLEAFQIATLDLSRSDVPTLPMVLPLYKQIETKLEQAIKVARDAALQSVTVSISETAYQAALNKLTKYIAAACESPLHLVATALHPAMRLAWFENRTYWPAGAIAVRVRVHLTTMYAEYAEKYEKEQSAAVNSASRQSLLPTQASKSSSLLATALSSNRNHHSHEAELDSYLRGALGCDQWDDLLPWWKMNAQTFPVLSQMAQDVLAAPGVSISVERLFSVCRHVMTESRTSMTAKTATKTICAKEWLHEGLGGNIESFSGLPSKQD